MSKIGLGIVGGGTIAQRVLRHLVQPDVAKRVSLTAICDPVAERARAAAEKFGIARCFNDYQELLACDEVNAVTIASPINFHFQQVRQALLASKHVHCNKTMATTGAEAKELTRLARERNLRLVPSPGEMLRPHNQYIKEVIDRGEIGALCWAVCGAAFGTYHEDERERQGNDVLTNIDPSWYFRKPGGGPLYDMTVYSLTALTGILGSVSRVTALSGTRIKEREFRGKMVSCDADDNTVMLLDFGENLFAFAYGTATGRVTQGFSGNYFGTRGSIVGLTMNGQPLDYPGADIVQRAARVSGDPTVGNQWLLPHINELHRDLPEQHVFEDVMQLIDWIAEGKPSPVTPEHATHVIDIIDAAYRASSTGQTQVLGTTVEAA
ncbi:MAG: Gfo/Idh/MocA family oxidoreductase [Verrucomicrobia bacterium]|nr:Gfo/Idh/MocA family oxidoreductase [Verrucomicrobiota bacterium]